MTLAWKRLSNGLCSASAPGRVEGKIVREGKQAVGPIKVVIWKRKDFRSQNLIIPVRFEDGPISVAADGSFATPKSLVQGERYRLVVQAEGFAPEISPWIKLDQESKRSETIVLKPFRSIRGRVVDRQAKPVADAEVFQSGDGPARTATRSDSEGRFTLDGYAREHAFVFASKNGFRFQGVNIETSKTEDVTITLTRTTEAPENMMKRLPDALSREERLKIVRRLIAPMIDRALDKGNDREKITLFQNYAPVDPAGALERLERVKFDEERWPDSIRGLIAAALRRTIPTRPRRRLRRSRTFRPAWLIWIK